MDLNKLLFTPFAEGFIRVATSIEAKTGETKYDGGFEILSRHHDKSKVDPTTGNVVPKLATHPITEKLMKEIEANRTADKVVEIPIRMFYNKPANAITANYVAYDLNGIPVCRGNGCEAKRRASDENGNESVVSVPCCGDSRCDLIRTDTVNCRRQISMPVSVVGQENPFSVYEVRTSSFNSLKALRSQLELISKRFNGLRHVPLKLQLWQASNLASNYEAFDLFKLNIDAKSEIEAMRACKLARDEEAAVGLVDDPDSTFEQINSQETDLHQVEEFAVVSDFYQPIHENGPGMRRAPASAKHAASIGTSTSASSAISSAIEAVARRRGESMQQVEGVGLTSEF